MSQPESSQPSGMTSNPETTQSSNAASVSNSHPQSANHNLSPILIRIYGTHPGTAPARRILVSDENNSSNSAPLISTADKPRSSQPAPIRENAALPNPSAVSNIATEANAANTEESQPAINHKSALFLPDSNSTRANSPERQLAGPSAQADATRGICDQCKYFEIEQKSNRRIRPGTEPLRLCNRPGIGLRCDNCARLEKKCTYSEIPSDSRKKRVRRKTPTDSSVASSDIATGPPSPKRRKTPLSLKKRPISGSAHSTETPPRKKRKVSITEQVSPAVASATTVQTVPQATKISRASEDSTEPIRLIDSNDHSERLSVKEQPVPQNDPPTPVEPTVVPDNKPVAPSYEEELPDVAYQEYEPGEIENPLLNMVYGADDELESLFNWRDDSDLESLFNSPEEKDNVDITADDPEQPTVVVETQHHLAVKETTAAFLFRSNNFCESSDELDSPRSPTALSSSPEPSRPLSPYDNSDPWVIHDTRLNRIPPPDASPGQPCDPPLGKPLTSDSLVSHSEPCKDVAIPVIPNPPTSNSTPDRSLADESIYEISPKSEPQIKFPAPLTQLTLDRLFYEPYKNDLIMEQPRTGVIYQIREISRETAALRNERLFQLSRDERENLSHLWSTRMKIQHKANEALTDIYDAVRRFASANQDVEFLDAVLEQRVRQRQTPGAVYNESNSTGDMNLNNQITRTLFTRTQKALDLLCISRQDTTRIVSVPSEHDTSSEWHRQHSAYSSMYHDLLDNQPADVSRDFCDLAPSARDRTPFPSLSVPIPRTPNPYAIGNPLSSYDQEALSEYQHSVVRSK
ncbi:hypothetical protein C8J56DRAFT_940796 [Mycena floridula]|nr:hypothetical protein C8J56DRAFT_940796 [Mycena floridula]